MTIIRYNDVPKNPNQPANAQAPEYLDIQSGHLFDAAGNTIGKWTPNDDEKTGAVADFCAAYSFQTAAQALASGDPERAAHMMSIGPWSGDATFADLGPADVHIPAALPNYASGYRNEPPMADVISPPLPTDKQVNDYWEFQKEDAFQRATPSVGAGGAEVGEISPRVGFSQYSCVERALGGFVTTQTEANADAPLRIMQATAKRVMNALILEREIRTQALLRTTANWNSAQVTTLAAGFQWNGGASSDPLKDIHNTMIASYGTATGILMPEKIWLAYIRNTAVRSYYGFKDGVDAVPNPDKITAALKIPPVYVAKMKYIKSDGTLDYVWGNDVILFRQPDESPPSTQDDVATSYTFRWNAATVRDGVASGGFIVRQFFVQHRGSMGGNKIVVVHQDAEKLTSKFIGGPIVNAFQ